MPIALRFRSASCALLLLCFCGAPVAGEGTASAPSPLVRPGILNDVGLVFTTQSLLLDLESYHGGVGVKVGLGPNAIRGCFDLVINVPASSMSVGVDATITHPLSTGIVSPYIGGYLGLGYRLVAGVASVIPISAGAVLGAEASPFEHISFFAEYCLAVDVAVNLDHLTHTTTLDFLLDTRVGNEGRIGIVIYLFRPGSRM